MPVTLRRLLAQPELELRALTGDLDTEIGWSHSSDLADPTPFMGPGNLLLTTGAQFTQTGIRAYLERLRAVGVTAIGFGTEVIRSGTPLELIEGCATLGLALVEVPYRTSFLAIGRWIADAIAAEHHARDLWTLRAQRSLSLAALGRGGLNAVLAELARQLAAQVTLFDSEGRQIADHGRLVHLDRSVLRSEARRLLGRRARAGSAIGTKSALSTLQTLGRGSALRGVLAVSGVDALDPAAGAVLTGAVALIEVALEDAGSRQQSAITLSAQLWELLLSGQSAVVRRVLAAAGRSLPAEPVQVVGVLGEESARNELLAILQSDRVDLSMLATSSSLKSLILLDQTTAHRVLAVARRRGLTAQASAPAGFAAMAGAVAEVEAALRAVDGGAGRSAAPGVLVGLIDQDGLRLLAQRRLGPLTDRADGPELRRTLRVWLSHHGQWEATARELGLHRHTVKAAVRQAASVIDLDLDSVDARAELWLLLCYA